MAEGLGILFSQTPVRMESTEKKIDGVLALLMALDRAQRMQCRPNYEVRGLWSI